MIKIIRFQFYSCFRTPSASQAAQLALAKASQINAKLGISGPTATAPPDLVQVGANTSDTMMVPDHMVGLCKFTIVHICS